ncbi:hypothetical protein HYC85_011798 [Camellia sinensis]|uniref:Uncharacterized protein n=1 Tax=Camellia sinensis TaxID=4442 RepID=A0A7J7HB02_CAMSI|nr:hypothetical protein HYC85_011798 [Camellia sinensis]
MVTLEAMTGQAWSCETVKDILSQDLWIKDLIVFPFDFFKRNSGERNGDDDDGKNRASVLLLEGILDLLPMGEKASKVIHVGFYFSLLSRSLELGLRSEQISKLQDQIALAYLWHKLKIF